MVNYPKGTHKPLDAPVQPPEAGPGGLIHLPPAGALYGQNKPVPGLIPTEAVEAAHFIKLCQGAALLLPDLMYVAHIPNGGQRNKTEAKRMQGEGVRAGYPDYILDVAMGGYFGWRGELKRVKYEYPRDNQYEWLERLRGQGYWANWHRGAEAMFADLVRYLEMGATYTPPRRWQQTELEQKPVRSGKGKTL